MSNLPTAGIDAISIFVPNHYLDIRAMAKARDVDGDKYTEGLGLKQMAVPCPHEDTITMAVAASKRLLANYNVNPADIGMLIVASESPIDTAKATAAYVHGLLKLSKYCRTFDIKQACYGGTAALKTAAQWCQTRPPSAPKKALVIATDIARYEAGSPGEPTQGAGAVAMLVAINPKIMTFAPYQEAVFTEETMDFWRPTYRSEAVVNGRLSIKTYLKALEYTYQAHREVSGLRLDDFDALLFHTPFPKMALKAHKKLYVIENGNPKTAADEQNITDAFNRQTGPSLFANKAVGNIYTGALYLSLATLLEQPDISGKTVGLFSYGSGASAEFFTGIIGNTPSIWRHKTGIDSLSDRIEIVFSEYQRKRNIQAEMAQNNSYSKLAPVKSPEFGIAFMGIDNHRRIYTIEETETDSVSMPIVAKSNQNIDTFQHIKKERISAPPH